MKNKLAFRNRAQRGKSSIVRTCSQSIKINPSGIFQTRVQAESSVVRVSVCVEFGCCCKIRFYRHGVQDLLLSASCQDKSGWKKMYLYGLFPSKWSCWSDKIFCRNEQKKETPLTRSKTLKNSCQDFEMKFMRLLAWRQNIKSSRKR